jgi:hypothetical protein
MIGMNSFLGEKLFFGGGGKEKRVSFILKIKYRNTPYLVPATNLKILFYF